jgi:hypothetical protein
LCSYGTVAKKMLQFEMMSIIDFWMQRGPSRRGPFISPLKKPLIAVY